LIAQNVVKIVNNFVNSLTEGQTYRFCNQLREKRVENTMYRWRIAPIFLIQFLSLIHSARIGIVSVKDAAQKGHGNDNDCCTTR